MPAALTVELLTLFPEMVKGFLAESMLGRAVRNGILEFNVHNIRDWSEDKHQITDDRPFGGGAGMVLKPEPLFAAVEELRREDTTVIYMAPDGEPLDTGRASEFSKSGHLIIISGHYEGIDERVRETLVDREISIGDYVLTNGTLPACVFIDAVSRHVPGVLGEELSLTQDSFNGTFLTFPQYTRPAEYRGMRVPDVLLSGNHNEIAKWRDEHRVQRTRQRRPDLINNETV